MTQMTTLTTPKGRTFKIESETARTLELVGLSLSQIDTDIDQIVSGGSLDALLSACQGGAEDGATLAAWSDYAHECMRIADNESLT